MKTLQKRYLLTFMVAVSLLTGCKKVTDSSPSSGVVGTWRLTNRQCYCAPAPLPNETVVFTNTNFFFYKNRQLTASGTYVLASVAPFCSGGSGAVPGLRFTVTNGKLVAQSVAYTVSNGKLVLDYGGPCDAPVDTYERQ